MGRLAVRAVGMAADTTIVRMHRLEGDTHSQQGRVHEVQETIETFIGLIPWIQRIFSLLCAVSLLLSLSMAEYGLFYIMVMPGNHATDQLYFDYTCRAGSRLCDANEVCSTHTRESDTRRCSPVTTMDLFMRHAQWEGFHDDVLPQPLASKRVLKQWQPYFIEIVLNMPESEANSQAGMFSVAVELQSSNGTALASSIRSARLPHESPWVGVVRKVAWLPGLLVGALTESRTLMIPSFRHYIESPDNPLVRSCSELTRFVTSSTHVYYMRFPQPQRYITVRILARGNEWRETPVEIVRAEVRVGEELNRFQRMLKDLFYTCCAIGTLTLFVMNSVLLAIGVMLLKERRRLAQEESARAHAATLAGEGTTGEDDSVPLGGTFDHDGQREGAWGDERDDWNDLPTTRDEGAQESDLHVIPEANDQGVDGNATNDTDIPQNISERDSTASSEHRRT